MFSLPLHIVTKAVECNLFLDAAQNSINSVTFVVGTGLECVLMYVLAMFMTVTDCFYHLGVLVMSSYVRAMTIAVATAIEIRTMFCPSVVNTICHIVRCRFCMQKIKVVFLQQTS